MNEDRHYTECTPEKRARFCELLSEGRTVTSACEELAMSRSRIYQVRREDKEFATAWDEAAQVGADVLEDEARRRAMEGVEEPVFYKGDECGQIRRYSDTLLIFLLKGAKPEKYRERYEHSGPGGGSIPISVEAAILKVYGDSDSDESST